MTDTKRLDESMRELRSQIGALDVDDQSRQQLRSLIEDLEATLRKAGDAPTHQRLGERLNASVLQFEVSHPRVAVVLNELMEKVSKMGI